MIVVLDERDVVRQGFVSCFVREGMAAMALGHDDFIEWFRALDGPDVRAIEGFVIGRGGQWRILPQVIAQRTPAPVICIMDERSLKETLAMFAAGVDDVVAKPVHVRELRARLTAIRERAARIGRVERKGEIQIFEDGQDPIVGGQVLALPRRERRILECLMAHEGAWVTKAQIFRRVYGLCNEEIDENVIESHISRLRKRLRSCLMSDPIESQRYLGYRLRSRRDAAVTAQPWMAASLVQANDDAIDRQDSAPIGGDNEHLGHHADQCLRYVSAG